MDEVPPSDAKFEQLLGHGEPLRRLAWSLSRDRALAEDLIQDTWLATFQRPPDAHRNPKAYMETVMRNRNRLRWRYERRYVSPLTTEPATSPSTAEEVERQELRRILRKELRQLPECFRSVLIARIYRGHSYTRIAREREILEGTARTRYHRALERLRSALDRRYGGERHRWLAAIGFLAHPGGGAQVAGPTLVTESGGPKQPWSHQRRWLWTGLGTLVIAGVLAVLSLLNLGKELEQPGRPPPLPGTTQSASGVLDAERFERHPRQPSSNASSVAHEGDASPRASSEPARTLWLQALCSAGGRDVDSVEIYLYNQDPANGPRHWARMLPHPDAHDDLTLLATERRSPVCIEIPQEVCAILVGGLDRAWQKVEVQRGPGVRTVLLDPEAKLAVEFANQPPAEAKLRIRRENKTVVGQWDLSEVVANQPLLLDGFAPGDYRLTVEVGKLGVDVPVVLARADVELVAGRRHIERMDIELVVPTATADLGGWLTISPERSSDNVSLEFHHIGRRAAEAPAQITLARSNFEFVSPGRFRWFVKEVPIGAYRIRIQPYLVQHEVHVPEDGNLGVELETGPLSEVIVQIRPDPRIHREFFANGIRWGLAEQGDRYGTTFHKVGLNADSTEATFFAPLEKTITIKLRPPNHRYRSEGLVELTSPLQHVLLRVRPTCVLRITAAHEITPIPINRDQVSIRDGRSDPVSARWFDEETPTEKFLFAVLDSPGRYEVVLRPSSAYKEVRAEVQLELAEELPLPFKLERND